MVKKPLIVVSLCAVVLLVLGSLSNVVGAQEVKNSKHEITVVGNTTSTSMKTGGLKLLNMRIQYDPSFYTFLLKLDIQNNGTETIHKFSWHIEYYQIFNRKVNYSGNYWDFQTVEPQETCFVCVGYMPLSRMTPSFFQMYIDMKTDVSSYNHLIINDRYRFSADGDSIRPMDGILDWLVAFILR